MEWKEVLPWLGLLISLVLVCMTVVNNHRTVRHSELADLQTARTQEIMSLRSSIDQFKQDILVVKQDLVHCLKECEDYQKKNTDLLERLLRHTL